MQRSASSPLLPLAAALERLLLGVHPVPPRRATPAEALGAIASEDIGAASDLPALPIALRDGWAVSFSDVAGASPNSPVWLPIAPAWIEAGAAMPHGADTVLPPDAIEPGSREVTAEASPGEGVAGAGAELRVGDVIVAAGERVGPQHLLALAYVGFGDVAIRIPRIALLATGGERARQALTPLLAALITEYGGEPMLAGSVSDGVDETATAIARAAEAVDAVFVIGGTGFGRTDYSAAALSRGGMLDAHGIGLRPGETAGFGRVRDRPVLLLPGSPDAAVATFVALGRHLLARLVGCPGPVGEAFPLARKISSGLGTSEVIFVRRTASGLEPLGGAGIPLRRLLQAEGFVLVPPDREGYPAGAAVEMMQVWTSR